MAINWTKRSVDVSFVKNEISGHNNYWARFDEYWLGLMAFLAQRADEAKRTAGLPDDNRLIKYPPYSIDGYFMLVLYEFDCSSVRILQLKVGHKQ